MKIHVIEKEKRLTREDKLSQEWESGFWFVSKSTAESLVGGEIYFHKARDKASYFGGEITGFRVQSEGEWEGRIIFQFTASIEYKNVKTSKSGWGMEKKIVKDL